MENPVERIRRRNEYLYIKNRESKLSLIERNKKYLEECLKEEVILIKEKTYK